MLTILTLFFSSILKRRRYGYVVTSVAATVVGTGYGHSVYLDVYRQRAQSLRIADGRRLLDHFQKGFNIVFRQ